MKMKYPYWERQEFDTNKSFQAFCIYRDISGKRSLDKVSISLDKSVQLIKRWSAKYNWVARIGAYDQYLAQKRLDSIVDLEQSLIASDFETLIAVNRELLIRLEETADEFTPKQLLRLSGKLYKRYQAKVSREIKRDTHWLRLRFQVLERDGFQCQYCGKTPLKHGVDLQVDHITPRSSGGDNSLVNLITACRDCNLGKLDVLLTQREEEKLKQHLLI